MPLEVDIMPVGIFDARLTELLATTSLDITSTSISLLNMLLSHAQAPD